MASNNTETRNLRQIDEKTGNLYESIAIIAKRSNQIGVKIKDELNNKLSEFASSSDNLEEVFENREQIEISKHYERMPKPTLIAIEDFMEDKVYFRNPLREKKDK
jgi:BioD-like phosphotransacetylase family protein